MGTQSTTGSAAFDTHVEEQPHAVRQALGCEPPRLDTRRPILFTGIGTSLHACRTAAAWVRHLTGGRLRAIAVDAHDLALNEPLAADDQVVVVSHRGTKTYPNAVLSKVAEAGGVSVAVSGQGDAKIEADTVLRTCPQDRASTHTISYTSALATLGRIVAHTLGEQGEPLDQALRAVPDAMERTLELPLSEPLAEALAGTGTGSGSDTGTGAASGGTALIAGTGLDTVTAAEAALKIKEGTYRWAEGLHTEFALHGTPAVFSARTVSCLIRPEGPDGGRTDDLAGLLRALGAPVFESAASEDADLPFAPGPQLVRPLVSVVPFQRLVSATARLTGASPDLTHTETEPWTSAMTGVRL